MVYKSVDIQNYAAVEGAVKASVQELGHIDILVNNVSHTPTCLANLTAKQAGLALGAPAAFHDLRVADILTMNITSVTGLEVPPFPGEAVYHSNKAGQEAFTNALRNELSKTNIRVLALRPGVWRRIFIPSGLVMIRRCIIASLRRFSMVSPISSMDVANFGRPIGSEDIARPRALN